MNPETKLDTSSIQALHDKYMFPCVSNYYEDPLPLAHGKGMYLTDLDGTDYLDFFGGILTVSVGHCNEHVNASLHRQIDTLQHTSTLYPTAPMVNLAKKLAASHRVTWRNASLPAPAAKRTKPQCTWPASPPNETRSSRSGTATRDGQNSPCTSPPMPPGVGREAPSATSSTHTTPIATGAPLASPIPTAICSARKTLRS